MQTSQVFTSVWIPSYEALSNAHKSFVHSYLICDNDAVKACIRLHPDDDIELNKKRAAQLMMREDIRAAIADKTAIIVEQIALKREDAQREIAALMFSASQVDAPAMQIKRFQLECWKELNRIGGFHQVQHNHVHQRDIQIHFERVNRHGQPVNIPPADVIPELPAPNPTLPCADPVKYTLEDLDDISEPKDDLPPDLL